MRNIAGYKFISLTDLASLQQSCIEQCQADALKGTILLSEEGINISLAGEENNIQSFLKFLKKDSRFSDMRFHETWSEQQPFQTLKIKIKKEIITLRQPSIHPDSMRAPAISPEHLKQWLDEGKEITLLDTRNDYEVRFGSFNHATHLDISDFGALPASVSSINREKPIVMFCTGGIRCEKAALYMLNHGYENVYQLDGGILGYFREVGGQHYHGECFVFDERVSVDSKLQPSGSIQCKICQGPITLDERACRSCETS